MGVPPFWFSAILLMWHYHLVTLFPSQYNLPRAQVSYNKTRVATANNKIVIIDFTVENNQFVNRAAVTAKSTVSARLPGLSILIKMRVCTVTIIPKTPEPTLIKSFTGALSFILCLRVIAYRLGHTEYDNRKTCYQTVSEMDFCKDICCQRGQLLSLF